MGCLKFYTTFWVYFNNFSAEYVTAITWYGEMYIFILTVVLLHCNWLTHGHLQYSFNLVSVVIGSVCVLQQSESQIISICNLPCSVNFTLSVFKPAVLMFFSSPFLTVLLIVVPSKYNTYYMFGKKFANFNKFYNVYERTEQLWFYCVKLFLSLNIAWDPYFNNSLLLCFVNWFSQSALQIAVHNYLSSTFLYLMHFGILLYVYNK